MLTSYVVPFQKILPTDRNDFQGYLYQCEVSQDIDTERNLLTSYVVPFQKIFATDRNDSHGYVYQWGISQDIEKLNKIGNCIISYLILKLSELVTETGN